MDWFSLAFLFDDRFDANQRWRVSPSSPRCTPRIHGRFILGTAALP
ncbi:hypothetical protein [Streptomyces sp. NPDC058964]